MNSSLKRPADLTSVFWIYGPFRIAQKKILLLSLFITKVSEAGYNILCLQIYLTKIIIRITFPCTSLQVRLLTLKLVKAMMSRSK